MYAVALESPLHNNVSALRFNCKALGEFNETEAVALQPFVSSIV